jgi:predicted HTH transcriptional regulator
MFQMIGAGEKAGSGFPKILQAWQEQDWRAPALEEDTEQEEVCLRLTTLSLFPPEVTAEMERRFSKKLHLLDKNGRLALATAILEKSVTNERLQELTDQHPRDLTFLLKNLVKKGFLMVREKRRWSSYSLAPEKTVKGRSSLPHKDGSSQHKDMSSQHKGGSSQHKNLAFTQKEGVLVDDDPAPKIDNNALPDIVQEIRTQKRSSPGKMEEAILILCENRYVMCQELADMLKRNMETLKNHYLSKLVTQGKLVLRFPDQPTHPAQAYQAAVTADKGENQDG